MRRVILAAMLSAALSGQASASGIPVIDPSNLAQATAQVQHMLSQLTELRRQYDQMRFIYDSIRGGRALGLIANNPALRDNLPPEYRQLYDTATAAGSLAAGVRDIMRDAEVILENQEFDGTLADFERFVANRQRQLAAIEAATASRGQQAIELRHDQIAALMQQINSTADLKAAQDMQSRMAAELAMIQNETNRLLLVKMAQDAQARLADEQRQELYRRHLQGNGAAFPTLRISAGE